MSRITNNSSEVICKHGVTECIGDILVLCAADLPFPSSGADAVQRTPTIRYLGFANCLIGSYERIPEREFVQACALEHGLDFDAINRCASSEQDDPAVGSKGGLALLRESARHSEAVDVSLSCTIRLDEKIWCVRNGRVWKDCARHGHGSQVHVLVDEVRRLWMEKNQH